MNFESLNKVSHTWLCLIVFVLLLVVLLVTHPSQPLEASLITMLGTAFGALMHALQSDIKKNE